MTLNPKSIFVVRGYDVNGNQFGEAKECASNLDAVMTASSLLVHGCKCIDIDVLEPAGQTCQSG